MLLSRSPQGGLQVVELTATTVVLIFVGFFAYLGSRRDLRKELLFFAGLLLGTLLSLVDCKPLMPIANRVFRLILFAVKGGAMTDDPLPIWEAVKKRPPLVNPADPKSILWFNTGVFVTLAIIFYLLGNRLWRAQPPNILSILTMAGSKKSRSQMPRVLLTQLTSTVVGGLNGFLVAMFVIPRYLAATQTLVVIPGTAAWDVLAHSLRYAIVVVFLVFIVRGWQQAKRR
ncbi:MAG: hypothetical protein J7M16_14530 [Anaerolineae bacterium]|nr:hypothetical protein [Anaerolineae bacterium]RLC60710.1 MAG: hypothetical protein DRI80_10425 [Chloroflexota bacterium]